MTDVYSALHKYWQPLLSVYAPGDYNSQNALLPHPAYNSQNALPPVPFLLPAYLHHHSGKSGGESRLEEENVASKEK